MFERLGLINLPVAAQDATRWRVGENGKSNASRKFEATHHMTVTYLQFVPPPPAKHRQKFALPQSRFEVLTLTFHVTNTSTLLSLSTHPKRKMSAIRALRQLTASSSRVFAARQLPAVARPLVARVSAGAAARAFSVSARRFGEGTGQSVIP